MLCLKHPKTSQVPPSLLTSAGSPFTLKHVYFSGSCRLLCSQGLARSSSKWGWRAADLFGLHGHLLCILFTLAECPRDINKWKGDCFSFFVKRCWRNNEETKPRGVPLKVYRSKYSYYERIPTLGSFRATSIFQESWVLAQSLGRRQWQNGD